MISKKMYLNKVQRCATSVDKEVCYTIISVKKNTELDLVKNWNNGNNKIFNFSPTSEERLHFEETNKSECIGAIPES